MNKENLRDQIKKVLSTTAGERDRILNNRSTISRGELEISKTVISANKNIVTAVMVAKSLLTNDNNDN